jgi:hypothetical protein
MSSNQVLIIPATAETVLTVMPKVVKVLASYLKNEVREIMVQHNFENPIQYNLRDKSKDEERGILETSFGVRDVTTHDFKHFRMFFLLKGERRILHVHTDCHSDYEEAFKGDKLIITLDDYGVASEVMMLIGKVLREHGPVFYCKNNNNCEFDLI